MNVLVGLVAVISFFVGGVIMFVAYPSISPSIAKEGAWTVRISESETRSLPPGEVIAILNENTRNYVAALEASLSEKITAACTQKPK